MSLATIMALQARVRRLERALAAAHVELAAHRAYRTLGGPPPPCREPSAWTNVTPPPPPSASDPAAPPLHDGRGRVR